MSQETKSFSGKVVLITGASRGIGQGAAIAFGREGATVIGIARSDQSETAGAVEAVGGSFEAVRRDLLEATAADLRALVADLVARHGHVDVLLNDAGMILRRPALEVTEDDWNAVLRLNLSATFFLSQAVARWWVHEGMAKTAPEARLKIVNIASLLSFQGGILVPAYTASKSGVAGVTKALANEWSPLRINVNAIAPGYIVTENTRQIREDETRNKAILDRIPQGRWGMPEDIASGCLYLASPQADYLNGAILNIDGGWLGR